MKIYFILVLSLLSGCLSNSSDSGALSLKAEPSGMSIQLNWQQFNEYENGDPLPANEIDSFYISWQKNGLTSAEEIIVPGSDRGYLITGLSEGVHTISVRSKTVYGAFSMPSEITKNIVLGN